MNYLCLLKNDLKTCFSGWNLFEKIWYICFGIFNLSVYLFLDGNFWEMLTAICGMTAVILLVRGRISTYLFGLVNIVLYLYYAIEAKYYGETLLNIYFFIMYIYGFITWSKHIPSGEQSIKMENMRWLDRLWVLFLLSLITICFGKILIYFDNNLPYIDSFTTIASIFATILMIKRYKDQWIWWLVIDLLSVYMWYYVKNSNHLTLMWASYSVMGAYGYYRWSVMEKKSLKLESTRLNTI